MIENQGFSFVKRSCISCPSSPPVCNCNANEDCVITIPTCEQCPKIICTPNNSGTSSSNSGNTSSSSSPHTGAIAGGVVGGLAAFAIILSFLLWKFVYSESARQKRQEELMMLDQDYIDPNITPNVDAEAGFFEKQRMSDVKSARLSSVTMSSVNTGRGSNIIPIAYIPGVTSRQHHPTEQFFSASDILRESQISTDDNIRASIATTNYRGSAYVPSDVVTAVPMKPNLVELGTGVVVRPRPNPGLSLNTQEALGEEGGNRDSTNSTIFPSAQQAMRLTGAKSIRIGKSQPIGLQSELIEEEEHEGSAFSKAFSGGGLNSMLGSAFNESGNGTAGNGTAGISANTTAPVSSSSNSVLSSPPSNPNASSPLGSASIKSTTSRISRTALHISSVLHRTTTSNKFDKANSINEQNEVKDGPPPPIPSNGPSNPPSIPLPNDPKPLNVRFSTGFDLSFPYANEEDNSSTSKSIPPPRPSRPTSTRSTRSSVSKPSTSSRKTYIRESVEYVADDLPQEAYLYATSPQFFGDEEEEEYFVKPTIGSDEGRSSPFDDKYEHK